MADPTAIIGTVDLLARRLADLRLRYKDWLSNPEEYQRLSTQLQLFVQDLHNVNNKMKNISSLDQQKIQELHHFMQSIKSLFDLSKQDLDNLDKNILKQVQESLPDFLSTPDASLHPQAEINPHGNTANVSSTGQSSSNKPNDCSTATRVEKQRLKKSAKRTASNIKSFTRVKQDTEVLKAVDERLREGKNLLLNVSNFIHLQQSITLNGLDTPKFIQYFDSPFRSDNWVVDLSLTPSNANLNIDHTSKLQSDTALSFPRPMNLSQDAQVKQILLSFLSNPNQTTHPNSIPSLCVYGQGGMGKSVALQSICHDRQIRATVRDGVHFLTLGKNATAQDLIHQFSMCARHAGYETISKDIMGMKSAEDAAREVSVIFKGKRVLFVFDDLWVSDRSETGFLREIQVMGGMSEGAILFSTRDEELGRGVRQKIFFDFLEPKGYGSRMILQRCIEEEGREKSAFESLDEKAKRALEKTLELCGGWKLCLAVAGGALSEDIRDCGNDVSLGLTTYVSILREDELIHNTTTDYHERNLITVAESSVRRCEEWSKKEAIRRLYDGNLGMEEMFRSLCVIGKQKWMGMEALCRMWGVNQRYGETVVKQMGRMNLVSRKLETGDTKLKRLEDRVDNVGNRKYDSNREWVIRVHDRMIDVCADLADEKDDGGTKKWHKLLLDQYIQKSDRKSIPESESRDKMDIEVEEKKDHQLLRNRGECREWWDEKKMNGKYMMANLARHLVGDGMWDELFFLLTDVRWTLRRRKEGGWSALNDDYDRLIRVLHTDQFAKNDVNGIKILKSILRDAWADIRDEKHQIGFQVFGRLVHADGQHRAIARYKSSIEHYGPRPWLKPSTGTLRKKDDREVACLHPAGACILMCLSLDGKYLISSKNLHSDLTRIFLTNLVSQEVTHFDVQTRATIICYDFCFETWQIAIGLKDGSIEIRDANSGNIVGERILAHEGAVRSVSLNASGSRLVSAGTDKLLRIWDVSTRCLIAKPLDGHDNIVACTAYSRNGKFIVSGSYDNTLRIWNAETGLSIGKPLIGHESIVTCVAFNEQGDCVVSGSADKSLRVWDIKNNDPIGRKLTGHEDIVSCVAVNKEGTRIISGSEDKTVRIWNTKTGELVEEPLTGHSLVIRRVAFCENDGHVLSVSSDQSVRTWNIRADTSNYCPLHSHKDGVRCISFSRDGSLVASGSWDKTIRLWDTKTNALIGTPLRGHKLSVNYLAFNSDRTHIVSGSRDCSVRVWNLTSGKMVGQPLYLTRGNDLAYFRRWLDEMMMSWGTDDADHLINACLKALEENRNLIDDPLIIDVDNLNLLTSRETAEANIEPLMKYELGEHNLIVDTSSVSVTGDRKVKIADIRSGTAWAVHKDRTAHGLRDGRVIICKFET